MKHPLAPRPPPKSVCWKERLTRLLLAAKQFPPSTPLQRTSILDIEATETLCSNLVKLYWWFNIQPILLHAQRMTGESWITNTFFFFLKFCLVLFESRVVKADWRVHSGELIIDWRTRHRACAVHMERDLWRRDYWRRLAAVGWLVFLFKYKNRKTRDRYPNLGELVNRTTWKEFEQKEYRQTAIFRLCRSGPAVAVGRELCSAGGWRGRNLLFCFLLTSVLGLGDRTKDTGLRESSGPGRGQALTDGKIADCSQNTVMFQKVPSWWKYHDYLYSMIAILVKCFYKSEYDYHVIP